MGNLVAGELHSSVSKYHRKKQSENSQFSCSLKYFHKTSFVRGVQKA